MNHPTRTLADFDDPALPKRVVARCGELCFDWLDSALAGKSQPPVPHVRARLTWQLRKQPHIAPLLQCQAKNKGVHA